MSKSSGAEQSQSTIEKEEKKRHRSPAYPYVNLETAEQRCKQFFKVEGRGAAHLSVAAKHWGYDEKSSGSTQTIAALISFGLMQDSGSGNSRTVRLSQVGLRLVLDTEPDPAERTTLLRQAALSPKIHKELWTKYNGALPSDAQLKRILLFEWDPPFNHNSVEGFIKEFRDTIAFAKLSQSDKVAEEVENGGDSTDDLKVGDYVQWESEGQLQFDKPRKIIGFYESGWAKVEGTNAGIPVNQLTKENAPIAQEIAPDAKPPITQNRPFPPKPGMIQDVFTLPSGAVVLQWPETMTEPEYQFFEKWLDLMKLKMKLGVKPAAKSDTAKSVNFGDTSFYTSE